MFNHKMPELRVCAKCGRVVPLKEMFNFSRICNGCAEYAGELAKIEAMNKLAGIYEKKVEILDLPVPKKKGA